VGAEEKFVPATTWIELKLISPAPPEPEPVRSVPEKDIRAVESYLHSEAEARALLRVMIEVQRLTGMTSKELCGMRPDYLDNAGDVWVYSYMNPLRLSHLVSFRFRFPSSMLLTLCRMVWK
jgi:hypothetical protein